MIRLPLFLICPHC